MARTLRNVGLALALAILVALAGTQLLRMRSQEIRVSGDSIADMNVKKNAAGFAQDIFLAKLTESLGTRDSYGMKRNLFVAEVTETLKGDATVNVTVSVFAGVQDEPQLEVGKHYLIASRTHDSGEFETVAVAHEKPEGKLSPEERREWEEAIRNPTPYEDIRSGRAPSSQSQAPYQH